MQFHFADTLLSVIFPNQNNNNNKKKKKQISIHNSQDWLISYFMYDVILFIITDQFS